MRKGATEHTAEAAYNACPDPRSGEKRQVEGAGGVRGVRKKPPRTRSRARRALSKTSQCKSAALLHADCSDLITHTPHHLALKRRSQPGGVPQLPLRNRARCTPPTRDRGHGTTVRILLHPFPSLIRAPLAANTLEWVFCPGACAVRWPPARARTGTQARERGKEELERRQRQKGEKKNLK